MQLRAGAVALLVVLAAAIPAHAAPNVQGEHRQLAEVDARRGSVAPSAAQRAAARAPGRAIRFNRLGTAEVIRSDGRPLATGLPADPERAARAYLRDQAEVVGIDAAGVATLETLGVHRIGHGAAVLLRQRFGTLPAGPDGLVVVGVRDGAAWFVSSSLARTTGAPPPATLLPTDGVAIAARDAGRPGAVGVRGVRDGWLVFAVDGFEVAQARQAAVPTAVGARAAWEVLLIGGDAAEPLGAHTFVDARTGDVLVRDSIVDYLAENARFRVFSNIPGARERELWCWNAGPGCERVLASAASPDEWDRLAGAPTGRTEGNNARATENWANSNPFSIGTNYTEAPDREFDFAFTDQWRLERCNPDVFTSPQLNDVDAAASNLFAMHNRMHDFSYRLGFTETAWNLQVDNFGRGEDGGDSEHGNVQAGALDPNVRDNANQITPRDGLQPITNMYLWQPIAGAFYAPCVDGDYDMSVIGHEYTHAITNRMIAGPDAGLAGPQGGAMGESWSDLVAMEYLNAYGFAGRDGENPYAVGPYVTGDPVAGIRNYGMDRSPLNYSDVGYDVTGPQVHADGEIWSATNFAVRGALNAAYDAAFPSSDAGLQARCADGEVPVEQCPGNRRWVQLTFDSYLLQATSRPSFVDMRDHMLAADLLRFGGANQATLWNAFASRGLGEGASSNTNADPDPVPSFASPQAEEGIVVLTPEADQPAGARLFIGRYEARAVPIADTDPATALGSRAALVPGTYDYVLTAPGHGASRGTIELRAGQVRELPVNLPRNVAAATAGGSASGDGQDHAALIDETEASQWQVLDSAPVAGKQVTVDLAGAGAQQVRRVQVSALLRSGQNRFTALRSFALLACDATAGADCTSSEGFRQMYASPPDAFPSVAPRPRAPELIMRSFDVPRTRATHLRLQVLTTQCTGAPAYAGEQDDDPRSATDCGTVSTARDDVRVAELQVFER